MDIEEYATKHKHYWSESFNNPELKSLLDTGRFSKLIDVGCGDGVLLHQLNSLGYLKDVDEVWAIDLSKARLRNAASISGKIKVLQSDAQQLEAVPDNHFDLLISTQVIEHVENDFEMLRSLYRVAQPGAALYLDTVFKTRRSYYFYKNRRGERVLDPTHEREYTDPEDLIGRAKAANFDIMYSGMTPIRLSPLNFMLRFVGITNEQVARHWVLQALQKFRIRIPGYRCWKLILQKPL